MKNILVFVALSMLLCDCKKSEDTTPAAPTYISIPDKAFEQALIDAHIDSDKTINHQITSTDALNTYTIDVSFIHIGGNLVRDLTGIESFTNLTYLNCTDQVLTTPLNVSKNTKLSTLICSGTKLTTIDVSNCPLLEVFQMDGNQLTNLDVSKNPLLKQLWCSGFNLTNIDVSKNPKLTDIECSENQFTNLDFSNNILLTIIVCNSSKKLTNIDVSKCAALTGLSLVGDNLTSLNVSNNLQLGTLLCTQNKLTVLDVSKNTILKIFRYLENPLTKICVKDIAVAKTTVQWDANFSLYTVCQ